MVSDERIEFQRQIVLLAHESVTLRTADGQTHTLILQHLSPVTAVAAQRRGDVWSFIAVDGAEYGARDSSAVDPAEGRVARPPKRFTLKAGRLLLLTSGDYSSYGVIGLFRVVKDFDPFIESEQHAAEGQSHLAHLLAAGCIEEVEHNELHFDDYDSDMWLSGPGVDR
jgi:hypothetical protein